MWFRCRPNYLASGSGRSWRFLQAVRSGEVRRSAAIYRGMGRLHRKSIMVACACCALWHRCALTLGDILAAGACEERLTGTKVTNDEVSLEEQENIT